VAPVLQDLGRRFEVERTSLKPFPTCRFTHAPTAALQGILRRSPAAPGDLDQVEARVTSAAFAEVCEPLEAKRQPQTRVHAQFSLPHAPACIAHHGTVALADLTEDAVRRPELLALADRVRCLADPALDGRRGEKIGEAEVQAWRRDGSKRSARALPPGGPDRPLTTADRLARPRA
jgi:2-methylcitrate dehydratase PrpD